MPERTGPEIVASSPNDRVRAAVGTIALGLHALGLALGIVKSPADSTYGPRREETENIIELDDIGEGGGDDDD